MTKPVELTSKSFRSQKAAEDYFRDMLHRYGDGDEVNEEDHRLLYELLQRHPEAEVKIGISGVRSFYRARTDMYKSCFFVMRKDGSTTDFSLRSCITGQPPSLKQEFYEACMQAVSAELMERKRTLFREAGGTLWCSKTGECVTLTDSEYRHTAPKFREIVNSFVEARGIEVGAVGLSVGSDMQYVTTFTDAKLEEDFKTFHSEHAQLAIFKKHER